MNSLVSTKACGPTILTGFPVAASWVQVSAYTSVIPAVLYLPTGLAEYLVGPGISRGARKLVRTPRVIKNKKRIL
jgi:hypothetical protein